MNFMEKNKRRPSKYKAADMKLVNWLKHNRKLRNKGLLQDSRKEKLNQLLEKCKDVHRVNQYAYPSQTDNTQTLFSNLY